jgi:hypothetical protein
MSDNCGITVVPEDFTSVAPEIGALRTVSVLQYRCPGCQTWGDIDDDQYHGRTAIVCPMPGCGFHVLRNLEAFAPPAAIVTARSRIDAVADGLDVRARAHDCPGYDCATCGTTNAAAELREVAASLIAAALPPEGAARRAILYEFAAELERAEAKHGPLMGLNAADIHRAISILVEEVGEVAQAALDGRTADVPREIVQVGAVALGMMEACVRPRPRRVDA